MTDIVSNITIGQIVKGLVLVGTGLTFFIEISNKFHSKPISKLFSAIGAMFNAETISRIDGLEDRIKGVEDTCNNIESSNAEKDAIDKRIRILQFGDEIRRGMNHSLESFNQIFDDISSYETYCRNHPEFKNDKTVMTIAKIKEEYKHHMDANNFL